MFKQFLIIVAAAVVLGGPAAIGMFQSEARENAAEIAADAIAEQPAASVDGGDTVDVDNSVNSGEE